MGKRPIVPCGKVLRKEVHKIHVFEFQQDDDSPKTITACCLGWSDVKYENWCAHVDEIGIIVYEITAAEKDVSQKNHACKDCLGENIFLMSRYGKLIVQRE